MKHRGPLTTLATSRKARWWAAVIVALPMLYAVSMPFMLEWADKRGGWIRDAAATVYGPLLELMLRVSGDTL